MLVGCNSRREGGSYVERTIISIAWLDERVQTVVSCIEEKEKHGSQ